MAVVAQSSQQDVHEKDRHELVGRQFGRFEGGPFRWKMVEASTSGTSGSM